MVRHAEAVGCGGAATDARIEAAMGSILSEGECSKRSTEVRRRTSRDPRRSARRPHALSVRSLT